MTTKDLVRRLVPAGVGRLARDLVGVTALQRRVERIEALLHESKSETWERSRRRWRDTSPTVDLTWGETITGDPFIEKAASYAAFDATKSILEIGPGYGRLLKALLAQRVPFKSYLGVDISAKNVGHLKETFVDGRIRFVEGDIERISLEDKFDVVISSLVFKHLFPTFANPLHNIARALNANAVVLFDLIEGQRTFFEDDNVTYVHQYTKEHVTEILNEVGLRQIAFDVVHHDHDQVRLLVVAGKPS